MYLMVLLLLVIAGLQVVLLFRRARVDAAPLAPRFDALEQAATRTEAGVRSEISQNRSESADQAVKLRSEVAGALKGVNDSLINTLGEMRTTSGAQLEGFGQRLSHLSEANEKRMLGLQQLVEQKLTQLREENSKKLDEIRHTVDEKLQGALEKRLTESFKLVSERLELVHKGLGEMQTLASGVGDLKKVLTNVKTRGTWGEVQLGNLLEQMLAAGQYAQNVAVAPDATERVEYAIRLPGRRDDDAPVWLPIDAKFPLEDYQRLVEAAERGDLEALQDATKQLDQRIRLEARRIRDKYVAPPHTTDFALLFLPTEGLYAEVLRRPGLTDALQREYRVTVAGPTTLTALLNSLQLGFRTLAIEKHSSHVWKLLETVKAEFHKYGEAVEKVAKKLNEASNVIEKVQTRTRVIERKLRDVKQLPESDAGAQAGPPRISQRDADEAAATGLDRDDVLF